MSSAIFIQSSFPSKPLNKSPNTHFVPSSKLPVSLSFKPRTAFRKRFSVRAGLIEPDGGKLVDLHVAEPERELKKREAASLPRVKLTRIDLQWVHVLSEGWASPLTGFMREPEFLQTLHFNSLRLDDGSFVNMSVPIVLAIDDSQKERIGESNKVTLVDSDDNPVAILTE
ncbi:hypothetical protein V6N13_013523 [Hibiscus sabdariffa]